MTIDEAIRELDNDCPNDKVRFAIDSIMNVASTEGTPGLKLSIQYILKNLKSWKSSNSKEIKRCLKGYIDQTTRVNNLNE